MLGRKRKKKQPSKYYGLSERQRRVAVRARRFVGFAAVAAVTLPPGRR
jgi:hypothetical protein